MGKGDGFDVSKDSFQMPMRGRPVVHNEYALEARFTLYRVVKGQNGELDSQKQCS